VKLFPGYAAAAYTETLAPAVAHARHHYGELAVRSHNAILISDRYRDRVAVYAGTG